METKIKWKNLLCEERRNDRRGITKESNDGRTAFDQDYSRIVFSPAFRRLQDKAQVFPLEKQDFIRTRLTHSLEVAAIAESIGINIGSYLINREDVEFNERNANSLRKILECIGLLHDIGNTPFGHFGEEAIQKYFENFFKKYDIDNIIKDKKENNIYKRLNMLNENGTEKEKNIMKNDFIRFDGNAQILRVVCSLENTHRKGGLNLTYGTLSALIKYPRNSIEGNQKEENQKEENKEELISYKKYGYLYSEKEMFDTIINKTGLIADNGHILRNPIVYILEAADDIAYAASDIEDGIKKGLLEIDYLEKKILEALYEKYKDKFEENEINNIEKLQNNELKEKLKAKLNESEIRMLDQVERDIETGCSDDKFTRAQMLRVAIQSYLISCVTETFKENYEDIMNGTYEKELLLDSAAKELRIKLKKITIDKIFNSKEIVNNELAGEKVIKELLDLFTNAVIYDREDGKNRRLYKLISKNYRDLYENKVNTTIYDDIQLVVDFISGMTDSYALDLYKHLQGILI